ncbi:MAG: polysaccharide pyruvyl transferase family protein [Planctomycetota bacterium]|jgi:hypothetical protein
MRRYANIYRYRTRNVGDLTCSPCLYFGLGPVDSVDIEELTAEDIYSGRFSVTTVILGGGGIFYPPWLNKLRILFVEGRPKGLVERLIVWGAGLNAHDRAADDFPNWVRHADLIGVRDFGKGLEWVPCASCMSSEFDRERRATHEIAIYDHMHRRVPVDLSGVPRTSNGDHVGMSSVLDFLGSAEVILTTSYHGAYWAALLGKRVVAWPSSSKFHYIKHAPALATDSSWKRWALEAHECPEALTECRNANYRFYRRIGLLSARA